MGKRGTVQLNSIKPLEGHRPDYSSLSDMAWIYQTRPEYLEKMKLLQVIREGTTAQLTEMIESSSRPDELLNIQDDIGVGVLHMAARFDKPDMTAILLKHGANPNAFLSVRHTPFAVACRFSSIGVIKVFLKHGVDPLFHVKDQGNALHSIARFSSVAVAELVYKKCKPPVDSRGQLGNTPLHYAAQYGNDAMCRWLLQRGADIKARCTRMATPFMIGCKQGHINVMHTLFLADTESGEVSALTDVDDEWMGCLHYAVSENQYQASLELLQWGANPNTQNVS
ncbi:ankyrin-1-like [Physella acuta]|uniref:ankyrin-1-like n=1 Tax=Physella acuta TaxID=109671 RepID=UPI0027DDE28B|nr:ankyrin-1-like [Physella acuta]